MKFDQLSLEQGLSQSTVNAIVQDGEGFMWFGTQDGLNRYDGYTITPYKYTPQDTTSISDNSIWALCRDHYGDLWIGTMRGGLNRYLTPQDKFVHYSHDPNNPHSLSENNVTSVFEDRNGGIWIGTLSSGLNYYDRETNQFIHFRLEQSDQQTGNDNTIWSICQDQKNNVWVATWNGLAQLRLRKTAHGVEIDSLINYRHIPADPNSLSGNNVRVVYVDRKGILWIGTWGNGLNCFDPFSGHFKHYQHSSGDTRSLTSNLIYSVCEDSKGNLWVGTGDAGLNLYNPDGDNFTYSRRDPPDQYSLNNDIICSLYEDRTGTLWVGTGAGGVNRYDWRKSRFPHYRDDQNNPDDLSGNDVWSIMQDRHGELWIGTYGGGLNKFDRKNKRFTHYKHDPANKNSISHDNVLALCETKEGDIWIGTEGGGLDRFDQSSGRFVHHRNNPRDLNTVSQDEITVIREAANGDLWIGTNGSGVDRYNPRSATFVHYRHDDKDSHSLAGTAVMAIYEDRKGTIWIGTWGGGLHRFDQASDSFVQYQPVSGNSNSLNNSTVLSIYEDEGGLLWIGTYGGGLNMFDRTAGTFSHLTETDGLPNNVVYGILSDDNGNLWVSTNKGLSKYNPKTGTFRNYDVKDGLQGNEFNQGSYYGNKGGELFFGGINGFNAFYPDSITDNPNVPPVFLTSFKVFDKPVELNQSVAAIKELQLSYSQNFFSFEFVALNYTSTEKNRYAYMLEGLDHQWINAGNRRYASYTNLDPKEYILRVKGANNDGVWNEQGIAVGITIIPPYWKTWWFRFLATASVVCLLFLMYRYRIRKLLEIERLRSSIATDLHDDIGSTLTEIALFSDVGLRELRSRGVRPMTDNDVQKLTSMLEEIGSTARNLIDAMNDIVWSIDPKNDSFDFLLLRMKTHAARMMEAKGINYEIEIPSELSELRLSLGFRRRLFLIFKEAVNNIIKHANPTKVRFQIKRENNSLVMIIADNGVGFDNDREVDGNGLRNMQTRARSLQGSLSISTVPHGGTTISLRAPI